MNRILIGLALAFHISQTGFAMCLNRTDGMVPQGTSGLVKDQTGNWGYAANTRYKGNFEFELRKEFPLSNGAKAAVVMVYAPGYSEECFLDVLAESDLVLYQNQVCAPNDDDHLAVN